MPAGNLDVCLSARSRRAEQACRSGCYHLRRKRSFTGCSSHFRFVVDRQVSHYEKNVVEAAEAMPADKFDFTPASLNIPGAAYKDVRTFAQLVKHTATANYRLWTNITGEKMPENIKGPNGPDELKTKAEIIQFLKDSFAVGHRAAKTLTAQNALEETAVVPRQQRLACSWLPPRSFMLPMNTAR